MQRFALLVLLISVISCTDSGSPTPPPQLPDAPTVDDNARQPVLPIAPSTPVNDHSSSDRIPQVGDTTSFEFGTWNIENFPKSDRAVSLASEVIQKSGVDLMALEEVASAVAFQQLLDGLPGFAGVLSPHQYDAKEYQKLAFVYREADLDLLDWELLFVKQSYNFPRPPLQAHFRIKTGDHAGQDMYMIAVHLKATAEDDSQQRREQANKLLEAYVSELMNRAPGVKIMLLGDFNERVNYTAGLKVFKPWLDKPDAYTFQTQPLAMAGEYSYISSSKPMIDHMISTQNIALKPITIPKLENVIDNYRYLLSDHLPVMAREP